MTRVFRIAVLIALVHALDDAFVHRGPGYGLGQHALAGLVATVAGVAAVLAFPRLRPSLRAALAFSYGVLAIANGVMHAGHLGHGGPTGGDVTGLLALGAGAVLVGLAMVIWWRRRSWPRRALSVPVGVVASIAVIAPVTLGVVATHKWREPVGDPPSAEYRDVTFRAADGLELAGWYRPSRNGAAVLLVHGGSSDRKGSVAYASMLARHGYGVLLYDARGRGESDGSENNYGWDWTKDVAGALGFLQHRPDVDASRIGALGISTGADALIEAVAARDDVAALVTDGAAAASYEDGRRLRGGAIDAIPAWITFQTIRVLSGDRPGTALEDAMRRLATPTLMISAGTAIERDFNVHYDRVATGPVEHWNLPDADHARAIRQHPREYEQRVVGFLDDSLEASAR